MTPDEYTNQELMLDVGDGHTLYVHDWGKADAKLPIITLHGGPGGGFQDKHKQRFDPTQQRIIFHDQRGCGRSTPYGSLDHNTTGDLVEDIEKIATELKLETLILTGGSWGACLALAYALKYPKRVAKLVVQGVFSSSLQEIQYLTAGMYRTHFPDVWDKLLAATPEEHRNDPADYHLPRIVQGSAEESLESAKVLMQVEGPLLSLDDRFIFNNDDEFDPVPMKLEAFYMLNDCFMPDRYILQNAGKLTMPLWIVQGRYDFVCPPITAYQLHNAAPNSQLIWTQAGHGNDRNNYEVMRSLLLQASTA